MKTPLHLHSRLSIFLKLEQLYSQTIIGDIVAQPHEYLSQLDVRRPHHRKNTEASPIDHVALAGGGSDCFC